MQAMEERLLRMFREQEQNAALHENTPLPTATAVDVDLSLPPAQPTEEKEPAPSTANAREGLGAGSSVTFLPPLPRAPSGQSVSRSEMEVVHNVVIEPVEGADASALHATAPQN
jgi:hypothetical protein